MLRMDRMKVLALETEMRMEMAKENFESKKNEWLMESLEQRKTKLKFPFEPTKSHSKKIEWKVSEDRYKPRWKK
jgi:hypothetical protein